MPIYEYECQKCKHGLEIMQRITDPVKKKCPKCKSEKVIIGDEFNRPYLCTILGLTENIPIKIHCANCGEALKWYPHTGKITERK